MIIKTGMKPTVRHQRLPRMGSVELVLEETSYLEPINNPEPLDVWVVTWEKAFWLKQPDFMLFTVEPVVDKRTTAYREFMEGDPKREQDHEAHVRRQYDIPADANVQRTPTAATHLNDVTITWWEVEIPS